ncbi:Imm9 family immunity protein [Cephaloticoccus capnophilus]|uniref:Imm9 family immunity protein n=1 Tax=Cephaloticoccus capnophilus TaxID=1548208 RepID=UPI0009EF480B|nr:Imm9 family immunity protein [Cephaloticoccus capnophilus]
MKSERVIVHTWAEVTALSDFAEMDSVDEKITAYIESILPRINTEDLSGWILVFRVNYRCAEFISIDKRFTRVPSDRECGLTVGIPIPDNTQAPYGIPPVEGGKLGSRYPAVPKHFHLLDPEYDKYANLEKYIFAAAIKILDFAFTTGFTCYKKKIKFQDL